MGRKILLMSVLFLVSFYFVFGVDFVWAKYPEKQIRLIVSFVPGGSSDLLARGVVRYVNPYLDDKVYVENIGGAGGAIGLRECMKATPDGYTIALLSPSIMTGPYSIKNYPAYDSFDPICIVTSESRMMLVKWDSPFKTLTDLISYAKANPQKLTAATTGVGSIQHVGMSAFENATGTKFTLVPYKGDGEGLVAAMGGHVDSSMGACSVIIQYVQGKKLRPLVLFSPKRHSVLKEVPTAKELGYDLDLTAPFAIAAPKGIPQEVKNVLVDAFRKASDNKGFKDFLVSVGQEAGFLGPEEAVLLYKKNNEFYKSMATQLGLKPE